MLRSFHEKLRIEEEAEEERKQSEEAAARERAEHEAASVGLVNCLKTLREKFGSIPTGISEVIGVENFAFQKRYLRWVILKLKMKQVAAARFHGVTSKI